MSNTTVVSDSLNLPGTIAPPAMVPVMVPAAPSATLKEAVTAPATVDALEQLQAVLLDDEDYSIPTLSYRFPDDFRLSVVIPVYNERSTIVKLLARVYALPIPIQIVVVDDCSTDGTAELLQIFQGLEPFRMVFKTRNEGKGSALRTGFQHADGSVVIVQDADLEYDPRDILSVIRPIVLGEADVVYGSRFLTRTAATGSSGLHRWGNRLLTLASNLTTGLPITDMETCYKAFRREVLAGISLRQDRFGFEPEITAKVARRGHRIQEVPVRYHARAWQDGKKIGWRDGCNALYCIARYALAD